MKKEFESRDAKNSINKVRMLEFTELGDHRGHIVVIEGGSDIPFDVKRVFYIYGTSSDVIRGQHANRHSSFCLINVKGKSKVKVIDQEGNDKTLYLDRPNTGIYIPPMIWKDMFDFSSDSVLLVLSDAHYDEGEYIRDYSYFTGE